MKNKKSCRYFAVLCFMMAVVLACAGCDGRIADGADVKTGGGLVSVAPGDVLAVDETTRLSRLTIGDGAVLTAPEGHSLTLTVDGVETPMAPGTYEGDVVLTVTDDIIVEYLPQGADHLIHRFRTAVYVADGAVVPEKSVMAAVVGGTVTDSAASGVSITSTAERFNGILVTGDSTYAVQNPTMDFTGNGGNDFAGFGAAIMSSGKADVTVDNAKIITRGAIRTAVFVGGESTMRVNNSDIEVYNGTLPEGYQFNVTLGKMMEVPWMLGLVGNCRATNLVDSGTAYYTDTTIKAQGWGCLSTDDAKDTNLYATRCLIETVESGYGSYSIGKLNHFSDCTFNVVDMALIMAGGGSGTFTDGTVVNSGRFGVVAHSGCRGTLIIDGNSVFNTEQAVILVKSCTPAIRVDGAKLNTKNGVILRVMENDDPYVDDPSAIGGPSGGMPTMGDMPDGAPGGMPEGMPEGMPGGGGVTAVFKNVTLKGDIINGDTASSGLQVTFEDSTITGAITTAVSTPVGTPSQENYLLMGAVKNTYCATNDEKGLVVTLGSGATWLADETSYLTGLTISEGATLTAPDGYRVVMKIDGRETPIQAGTYTGGIVIVVEKSV